MFKHIRFLSFIGFMGCAIFAVATLADDVRGYEVKASHYLDAVLPRAADDDVLGPPPAVVSGVSFLTKAGNAGVPVVAGSTPYAICAKALALDRPVSHI